jgi:hypothetical protein
MDSKVTDLPSHNDIGRSREPFGEPVNSKQDRALRSVGYWKNSGRGGRAIFEQDRVVPRKFAPFASHHCRATLRMT